MTGAGDGSTPDSGSQAPSGGDDVPTGANGIGRFEARTRTPVAATSWVPPPSPQVPPSLTPEQRQLADAAQLHDRRPLAEGIEHLRSLGLAVIPVNPWWKFGEKESDAGKVPAINGWQHEASTLKSTHDSWVRTHPAHNVGVATGEASQAVVIDLDVGHAVDEHGQPVDGRLVFEQWASSYNVDMSLTLTTDTPTGGEHLWFAMPVGYEVRNKAGLLPGVDVRATGGQAVVPPSIHRNGGTYRWKDPNVRIAPMPPQLLELLCEAGCAWPKGEQRPRKETVAEVGPIPTGQRNDTLIRMAGSMRRYGFDVEAIYCALQVVNRTRCTPPLDPVKVEKIARSAGRYEPSVDLGALVAWQLGEGEIPKEVTDEALRIEVREAAQRLVRNRRAESEFTEPPSTFTLAEELAIEDPPLVWTINGLHIEGMNTSLTARYKIGKTSMQANLLRSLCDDVPFLDSLVVRPLAGRVAFFNYELDDAMCRAWLRAVGAQRPDRASVLNLRGYRLDLNSDYVCEWVVRWLKEREVEFWLIDPFARAYSGNENDNAEVKLWTDRIDEIKREAGVRDCQVTVHMGRERHEEGEEHGRGATRLDDWVDARWLLTRDENGDRYLKAEGRWVDHPQSLLVFDALTGRLALPALGRDRRQVTQERNVVEALRALDRLGPGATTRALHQAMHGVGASDKGPAIQAAIEAGFISIEAGVGKAVHHTLTELGREHLL